MIPGTLSPKRSSGAIANSFKVVVGRGSQLDAVVADGRHGADGATPYRAYPLVRAPRWRLGGYDLVARYGLGRAYLETDAFAEAHSEFDRCFNRRGEATATNQIQIPDQWVAGLRTVATAEASTKILMDFINRLGQREAGINAEFDPEELASLIR